MCSTPPADNAARPTARYESGSAPRAAEADVRSGRHVSVRPSTALAKLSPRGASYPASRQHSRRALGHSWAARRMSRRGPHLMHRRAGRLRCRDSQLLPKLADKACQSPSPCAPSHLPVDATVTGIPAIFRRTAAAPADRCAAASLRGHDAAALSSGLLCLMHE